MKDDRLIALKVFSIFRNSWGGRLVFVAHVLFMGFALSHRDISLSNWPALLCVLLNLPQFTVLRLIGGVPLARTALTSGLLDVFISIPWWAYGVAGEFVVKRLIGRVRHLS
jgi:hypothetical protein